MVYKVNEDGSVIEVNHTELFPDTDFPVDLKQGHLPEGSGLYVGVHAQVPEYDSSRFKLVHTAPAFDGNTVVLGYEVVPYTETDVVDRAVAVRAARDDLLAQTVDKINPLRWASMSDAQKQECMIFRQSVLDITLQVGFPFNVEWPSAPAFL